MPSEEVKRRDIHLIVDGIRHRLSVPYPEEPHYRYAAEELNQAVLIYRNRFPNSSEIPQAGYLSMASIDTAYRLRKMRLRLEARDWSARLSALNQALEHALLTVANETYSSPSDFTSVHTPPLDI